MKINYGVVFEKVAEANTNDQKGVVIRGTAIKEVVSRNGFKYVAQELQNAAPGLKGKPILKDHNNSVDSIVGKVTESYYDASDKSIKFEGVIKDAKVMELVKNDLLSNVSIGASIKGFKDEKNADTGESYRVVEGLEILELSVTPVPGVPDAAFGHERNAELAIAEAYSEFNKENSKSAVTATSTSNGVTAEGMTAGTVTSTPAPKIIETAQDLVKQKEAKKMAEEMKVEQNALKEEYIALITELDGAWTKESLAPFDVAGLKELLKRAKTKVKEDAEKPAEEPAKEPEAEGDGEPKGEVQSDAAEEEKPAEKVMTLPAEMTRLPKNIVPGTYVQEMRGARSGEMWKMPDYSKYRLY